MLSYSPSQEEPIKMAIVGLGGAGNNILELIEGPHDRLYSANLDLRILNASKAGQKIHLGESVTHGLGSGGDPQVGARAAAESEASIAEAFRGKQLVILMAGLGGGTGSGAAPVMARIARKSGAFVVSIVVSPFRFEGARRIAQAREALAGLNQYSDLVLGFDNDRVESLLQGQSKALEAFETANNLLARAAEAITALAARPGLFHVGLDDLRAVVAGGRCLFGVGCSAGEGRAERAAREALACPLFASPDIPVDHSDVLVLVNGSESLTIEEIQLAMATVAGQLPVDAQIHFGLSVMPDMADNLRVLVFAAAKHEFEKEDELSGGTMEPVIAAQPAHVDEPGQETDETDTFEEVETPVSDAQLESIIRNDEEADDAPPLRSAGLEEEESVDYPSGPEDENDPYEQDDSDADEDESPVAPEEQSRPFMGEFSFELPPAARREAEEAPRQQPSPRREMPVAPAREQLREPSDKGLFSDDNAFIVDGEDFDLPPSMRKRR